MKSLSKEIKDQWISRFKTRIIEEERQWDNELLDKEETIHFHCCFQLNKPLIFRSKGNEIDRGFIKVKMIKLKHITLPKGEICPNNPSDVRRYSRITDKEKKLTEKTREEYYMFKKKYDNYEDFKRGRLFAKNLIFEYMKNNFYSLTSIVQEPITKFL